LTGGVDSISLLITKYSLTLAIPEKNDFATMQTSRQRPVKLRQ